MKNFFDVGYLYIAIGKNALAARFFTVPNQEVAAPPDFLLAWLKCLRCTPSHGVLPTPRKKPLDLPLACNFLFTNMREAICIHIGQACK